MKSTYTPPVVETVTTEPVTAVVDTKTVNNASTTVQPETPVTEMSETVALYTAAVDKHFKYINRELGFRTDKERRDEAINFIELTGRLLSTKIYMDFETGILYLINTLRNCKSAMEDGTVLRLTHGIEKDGYPSASVTNYRLLITYLVRLAKSWPTRAKAAKLKDVETLSRSFNQASADNLNYFMRKLVAYKI